MAETEINDIAVNPILNDDDGSFYRRLLVESVVERITRATTRAILTIFCWQSLTILVFLQSLLPDYGIYIHMASRALPVIYDDRRHITSTIKHSYLWLAGFGSGSKAILQLVWVGTPALAFTTSFAISYCCIVELHRFSHGTIFSFLLRELLKVAIGVFCYPLAAGIVWCFRIATRYEIQHPLYTFPTAELALIYVFRLLDSLVFSRKATLRQFRLFAKRRNMRVGLRRLPLQAPMCMPAYSYTRLQPAEIRLLEMRIVEGDPKIVRFSFKTTVIDNPNFPEYVALSYVWGPMEQPLAAGLEIDGKWLPVSSRVYELLHERARNWTVRPPYYFWIDSVCINQSDDKEKSNQVSMMHKIYSKAKSVVAYLQPDSHDESDVAIQFLQNLSRDIRQRHKRTYGLTPWLLGQYSFFFDGLISSYTMRGPSLGWNALTKLVGNEYWSRVWILQELVLAPTDLRLFYGDHELEWVRFTSFWRYAPRAEHIDFTYGAQVPGENINDTRLRIVSTFRLRALNIGDVNPRLTDMLLAVRSMGATDPRDRVYAFLGLEKDQRQKLKPDYTKPRGDPGAIESVYTNIAKYFLEHEDPEWILAMAGMGYSRFILPERLRHLHDKQRLALKHFYTGVQLNLPSWVPDLRSPYPIPLPNIRDRTAHEIKQNVEAIKKSIRIMDETKEVEIRTVFIDNVKSIATKDLFPIQRTLIAEHDPLGSLRRTLQLLDVVQKLRNNAFVNRPGESTVAKLYMTITAGLGTDRLPSFEMFLEVVQRFEPDFRALVDQKTSPLLATFRLQHLMAFRDADVHRWDGLTDVCNLREVAVSDRGYLALVPRLTRPGDCIHWLKGSETFLVLRRLDSGRAYQLVGHCYVHGEHLLRDETRSSSMIVIK